MASKKQSDLTNLYVKNFGKEMDESKLCQLFSVYGTITSCKIQTDENGQTKGFGFVNFERSEMAANAMEKLDGYPLETGKSLFVGPFQKKSERQNELRQMHEQNLSRRSNNLCLYVSNLDVTIDEKILEAVFARFGTITRTHIMRNGSQSKGVGFVCFDTMEETTRALNEMNGKWILSKPIYVILSKDYSNNSPTPSTPRTNLSHRATTPISYVNTPPLFYLPTMMVSTPTTNVPMPMFRPCSSPSPPNTTNTTRQVYQYQRVKPDDQ